MTALGGEVDIGTAGGIHFKAFRGEGQGPDTDLLKRWHIIQFDIG